MAVCQRLQQLFGERVRFQVPFGRGRADALLDDKVLCEIKYTQTADAFYQLQRYASHITAPIARVVVCAQTDLTLVLPERPAFVPRLELLPGLAPGFYVLPLVGKVLRR